MTALSNHGCANDCLSLIFTESNRVILHASIFNHGPTGFLHLDLPTLDSSKEAAKKQILEVHGITKYTNILLHFFLKPTMNSVDVFFFLGATVLQF